MSDTAVDVVIQAGSICAHGADRMVTTVHGLDCITNAGKKMNHEALCGYMSKQVGAPEQVLVENKVTTCRRCVGG